MPPHSFINSTIISYIKLNTMYGFIYKTICLVNNKIYIGQRVIVNQRTLDSHYLGSGSYFKRAVEKYGKENFKRTILCLVDNQRSLDKMEEFFIRKYDSTNHRIGYNILPGTSYRFASGAPMKNPEIAKRVTDKLRGRKGAKRSEESKKNMRVAAKKSWENADSRRQNISNIMKTYMENGGREHLSLVKRGKVFTDEHKCNISLHHADFSGDKHPLYGSRFHWINNGSVNKRLQLNQPLPDGFVYGKIQK